MQAFPHPDPQDGPLPAPFQNELYVVEEAEIDDPLAGTFQLPDGNAVPRSEFQFPQDHLIAGVHIPFHQNPADTERVRTRGRRGHGTISGRHRRGEKTAENQKKGEHPQKTERKIRFAGYERFYHRGSTRNVTRQGFSAPSSLRAMSTRRKSPVTETETPASDFQRRSAGARIGELAPP